MADLSTVEVEHLTRRGLRLAQFTVGYNVVEGVVSVTAGVLAGLRLAARLRHGEADEAKERRALKLVAVTFFVLAAYVTIEGIRSLVAGEKPESSVVGIVVLAASVIVMPVLAAAKMKVGNRLTDPLILADAAETRICVLLSISTLAGLVLYAITGAAWLDPVAGFVIALFAISEGREAWEGELGEHDYHH